VCRSSFAQWLCHDNERLPVLAQTQCFTPGKTRVLLCNESTSQRFGRTRLRAALASGGDPAFVAVHVEPLLRALGSDELCRGSCQAPLEQLVEDMYTVPGFGACLVAALRQPPPPGLRSEGWVGVPWFAVTVARTLAPARSDPDLHELLRALEEGAQAQAPPPPPASPPAAIDNDAAGNTVPPTGAGMSYGTLAARNAARYLRNYLHGSSVNSSEHGNGSSGPGKAGQFAFIGVLDLLAPPNGSGSTDHKPRHDNDASNFRDIRIPVTQNEVRNHKAVCCQSAGSHSQA
jgi:hypothetical protein